MSAWTARFHPKVTLDVPDGWSVEEHELAASFASDRSVMIVDVNVHHMPETDLVGMLAILMRSPGLRVLDLAEVEVGGRRAWRFEADVIEDMTYDGACGETADAGDRTVVHVVGADDRVLAIHATAHGARFGEHLEAVEALIASIRIGDGSSP